MRTKLAWFYWGLFIVSGGQFTWIWIVLLMRDINQIEGRAVYPTRVIGPVLAVLVLAQISLTLSLLVFRIIPSEMRLTAFDVLSSLSSALVLFLITSMILVDRRICQMRKLPYGILGGVVTFFLLILWGVSFLRAQLRLNNLMIESK